MDCEVEKNTYTFELSGLSTNMKIKKGSWIRLIPYDLRDDYSFLNFRNYLLTVDKKEWSSQKESFIIKTKPTRTQLFDDYKTIIETNRSNQWFVYPKENDNWTNKLYRMRKRKGHEEEDPESFLLRNKIGQSKLGSLVSIKWNIIDTLFQPQFYNSQFLVDLAEVYLFAPHLLEQFQTQQSSFLSDTSPEPNQSQKEAIDNSLNQTISAILGPPGTGKSQTIAALLNEYLERSHTKNPDKPVRILITSFSYNAMFVLIDMLETHKNKQGAPSKISKVDRYFVTSNRNNPSCHSIIVDYNTIKIHQIGSDTPQTHLFTDNKTLEDHLPKDFIMFGNAHQLKKLTQLNDNETGMKAFTNDFGFDLIIVDEASQYPTDHILSIFPLIYQNRYQVRVDKELTIQSPSLIGDVEHPDHQFSKLILVGDHNQLPPVQPIKPPKKLENILGSIYSYYVENHKIKQIQLKTNYRSNEVINQITQNLGFYELLDTFENNIGSTISFDYHSDDVLHKTVFDPNIPILSITHNQQYDSTISLIEAELVVSLVIEYFKLINPKNKSEFSEFWASQLGVVVPHNAQSNLIIQKIYSVLEKDVTYITKDELRNTISQSITSVEKFQGSARDMIICSIAISSKDQLRAEEEFIYGLNRFNVISSRARKKFVFICSQNYLNYLPSDQEMMNSISMIKSVIDNLMTSKIGYEAKILEQGPEYLEIKYKEF